MISDAKNGTAPRHSRVKVSLPPSGGKVVYCVVSTESQPMHQPQCPRALADAGSGHTPATQPQTAHPPAGPGGSLAH